jgi:galactose-1-phosphate uridylyltransferase
MQSGEQRGARQLSPQDLARLVQVEDLGELTGAEIVRLFRQEEQLAAYAPDGVLQRDPRDGTLIAYSSARARRPHDNVPQLPRDAGDGGAASRNCPICDGNTTGVIDVAPLSEGFTFINKNLFPVVYLPGAVSGREGSFDGLDDADSTAAPRPMAAPRPIAGAHFLQWTSSLHDRDWHNMPLAELEVVLERMARLEGKLLTEGRAILPDASEAHVIVIKNYGRAVGASLAHGHQQIALSSVMPRRVRDNQRFEERHGETFSAFLQRENPEQLLVHDYGKAVLVVPYFMRRPYDMILAVRDVRRRYLSELDEAELAAVARGWRDATRAIVEIMPRIGRDTAYNVTVSNGQGAGLYIEFLPYTQETGGFEQIGLWACQASPHGVAEDLRAVMAEMDRGE